MLILIQSFLVYFGSAVVMFLLGLVARRREKIRFRAGRRMPFWTWEIVASLAVFSFISGVRWNVGTDHQNYLEFYRYAQVHGILSRDFELGFSALTEWMASLGFHYSFYFGVLAFFQIYFVYKAFRTERYILPFIGLVVILGSQYLVWMNVIRQVMVATIFLYSVQFIYQRKWLHYFSFIVFASLIHKSALILLPIYFIPIRDFLNNRLLVMMGALLTIYVGMNGEWIKIMNAAMVYVLEIVGYSSYADRLDVLMEDVQQRSLGPRRLSIIFSVVLVVWYSNALKKRFSETLFLVYYNFAIMGFLTFNLLANTHHIFIRPTVYLTIFYLPVTAYLLAYLFERSKKHAPQFGLALFLACAYTPLSAVADYGHSEKDYSNYRFFWFHNY